MKMQSVSSSNLRAVGYDVATKILVVEFNSGTYEYYDVPKYEYDNLMSASSHGTYHAQNIKYNYKYKKIG